MHQQLQLVVVGVVHRIPVHHQHLVSIGVTIAAGAVPVPRVHPQCLPIRTERGCGTEVGCLGAATRRRLVLPVGIAGDSHGRPRLRYGDRGGGHPVALHVQHILISRVIRCILKQSAGIIHCVGGGKLYGVLALRHLPAVRRVGDGSPSRHGERLLGTGNLRIHLIIVQGHRHLLVGIVRGIQTLHQPLWQRELDVHRAVSRQQGL